MGTEFSQSEFSGEVIPLLQELVRIPSPYFHEDEIMKFTLEWLNDNGLKASIQNYHESKATGFRGKNVICTVDSGIPGPTVHLNGHLDTVNLCNGWTKDPYGGVIEGDRIYGLGALDMKSGCAAMMIALRRFKETVPDFKGKIIATFVSVEEGPFGLGSNALLESSLLGPVDVTLSLEPSAGFLGVPFPNICLGARGGYGLTIEVYGKASHAATTKNGINAAVDAAKIVCELENITQEKDEFLGFGELCVIKLEADGGACSVPDLAKIGIFWHIVRGETKATIEEKLRAAVKRADILSDYSIKFRQAPSEGSEGFMPYTVPAEDPYALKLFKAAEEGFAKPSQAYFQSIGDFNYMGTRLSAPCIIFGANGENFHSADEYVTISSLTGTTSILYDYLVELLMNN